MPRTIRKSESFNGETTDLAVEDPRIPIFVKEFCVDGNATRSALAAGYPSRSAGELGSRLLKRVEVRSMIKTETEKRLARLQISNDNVLLELARLAFSDPRDLFNPDTLDFKQPSLWNDDSAAAVQSLEVIEKTTAEGEPYRVMKVRYHSKTKALEMLMKHLGLMEERHTHTFENPLAILLAVAEKTNPTLVDESYLRHLAEENKRLGRGELPKPSSVIDGSVEKTTD